MEENFSFAAQRAIEHLHAYAWTSCAPGLSRTRALMAQLGHPERDLKFVHVTGTNGKGSTAAILAAVLREAGYRTGLYTSPHLWDFNERMQADGTRITDGQIVALTDRVLAAAGTLDEHPTEFELMTALAMLYFREMHCDVVVLEVGLGGRLDSTNVIPAPEAAVITNIGLEHTAILGDTLEKIAREKAGILKPGCRAVLYAQTQEVTQVVEAACRAQEIPLTVTAPDALERLSSPPDGQVFRYRGRGPYRLALLGDYQLANAMTALDTLDALRAGGREIPDEAVSRALAGVTWPARLELARRAPDFIVDGAHNPQCVDALASSLETLYGSKKLVFLAGVLADKDWHAMFERTTPLAKAFVTLTPASSRALPAQELSEYLRRRGVPAVPAETVADGVEMALALAGPDGAVCYFGSLYAAGEVRHVLGLC